MKEGSNLHDLFIEYEQERQDRAIDNAPRGDLRSVSARIPGDAYKVLEQLAERYGKSRSALAAEVLEAALWDLKPAPESTPKARAL